MTRRVVVVGGGFGGLCAAYALQSSGLQTTLVERHDEVGGKARNVEVAGEWVPAGPTVLTLREVFDRLFAAAGERLEDHVGLTPLERIAHHRWSRDERLDLYSDVERSAAAIEAFAGTAEADGYRRFVADAARVYATVEGPFVKSSRPDLFALARATGPFGAYKIKPFDTLWHALGRHFRDPRLQQLFGRYATYVGSSPFLAPATLMLIAHVEQRGVWSVEGGIAALAGAVREGIERHGGIVLTGTSANEIIVRGGAVAGVALDDRTLGADAVVCNADAATLGAGLLGPAVSGLAPTLPARSRTLSAVTFSALARAREPLAHHTVAFGPDYRGEFDALFSERRMPHDPTIYLCAPEEDRRGEAGDPSLQRLLIVMNAPADGGPGAGAPDRPQDETEEGDVALCKETAMATLDRCGIELAIEAERATMPSDFAALFPGTQGALYGRASHGWTASFQRPPIRTRIKGLYLAGGSVHPGAGVPMASLSGKIAAASLLTDFGFASRSRRVATSGGTSTG